MKIIFNKGSEYPWCWSNYLGNELMHLSQNEGENDICLCFGLDTLNKGENYIKNLLNKYDKVCFLDVSQHTLLLDKNFTKYFKVLKLFSHIFLNNKYTVELYKNFINLKNVSHIKVGFPINSIKYNKYRDTEISQKKIDLIHSGGIYSKSHYEMLSLMKKYNYIFTSYNKQNFFGKWTWNPFFSINQKKIEQHDRIMELQSQSKAAICINNNFPNNQLQNLLAKKFELSKLDSKIIPEHKGRMFELAATKTLMVVKYDKWKVIEDYLTPEKEFLYYYSLEDLTLKIKDIVNNYENYWTIIENAYEKISKYTPIKMISFIKNKLKI